MTENLTSVKNMFSAYLNQDFDLIFGTPDEAVQAFVKQSTKEQVTRAAHEIRGLLDMTISEHDMHKLLVEQLGCYYYYPAEWPSARKWLQHTLKLIEH